MFKLSSSMSDRIRFDEIATGAVLDKIENWDGPLSAASIDDLAADAFEMENFLVDDLDEAKARWISEWRRVFGLVKAEAEPRPCEVLVLPGDFDFDNAPQEFAAKFDDNGGEPDGNLYILPSVEFSAEEIEFASQKGGRVVNGWFVIYRSPERMRDAEPVDWCGYRCNEEAYALSREVAARLSDYCSHRFLAAGTVTFRRQRKPHTSFLDIYLTDVEFFLHNYCVADTQMRHCS